MLLLLFHNFISSLIYDQLVSSFYSTALLLIIGPLFPCWPSLYILIMGTQFNHLSFLAFWNWKTESIGKNYLKFICKKFRGQMFPFSSKLVSSFYHSFLGIYTCTYSHIGILYIRYLIDTHKSQLKCGNIFKIK